MSLPITNLTLQRGIVSGSTLIALSIFIVAIAGFLASYQFFAPTRSVTVIGIGRETALASKATITFVYTATTSLQETAISNGEEQFTALINEINGLNPTSVKRIPYQVQQVTAVDGSVQFQYVSGAQVTVQGQQNVTTLTRLLEREQAQIASIRYLPDDEAGVNQKVQQAALDDARKKAEQIAKASNASVGKVLVVTEQSSNAQSGSAITNVKATSTNDVEVQSTLSVTFQLR